MQDILDKYIDIVKDEETGKWYFQKFPEDGSGKTVESKIYNSYQQAINAYKNGTITW